MCPGYRVIVFCDRGDQRSVEIVPDLAIPRDDFDRVPFAKRVHGAASGFDISGPLRGATDGVDVEEIPMPAFDLEASGKPRDEDIGSEE